MLQIIATCANTVMGWLHQTLQLVVWIYAARMIQFFFIPLTAIRWLKIYAHFKSIFNGISYSYLPVTWEKNGTKPIREWIDDKEWTIFFSNWDTYSSFQQQEIKICLHKFTLNLFLRVWKEVSAIFIDYLRNIPSSPFLKMLAVFVCR